VRLRRYEQMSVHQAMRGMRISGLPWLHPPPKSVPEQQEHSGRREVEASGHTAQSPAPQTAGGMFATGVISQGVDNKEARCQATGRRSCPTWHAAQQRRLALWLGWLFAGGAAPQHWSSM
jgi:hypothetical protein